MNGPDPLAQLRDIHLPPPVDWWPPAPGWWLLLIFGLAIVLAGGHFIRRHIRRNRYRKEALHELQRLTENRDGQSKGDILEQVAMLLRRIAIQACGREEVAPLVGGAWLRFLDRKGGTDQFTKGAGKVLAEGLYRPTVEVDLDQLLPLVKKWIRRKQ
jgi:hypothetical protein